MVKDDLQWRGRRSRLLRYLRLPHHDAIARRGEQGRPHQLAVLLPPALHPPRARSVGLSCRVVRPDADDATRRERVQLLHFADLHEEHRLRLMDRRPLLEPVCRGAVLHHMANRRCRPRSRDENMVCRGAGRSRADLPSVLLRDWHGRAAAVQLHDEYGRHHDRLSRRVFLATRDIRCAEPVANRVASRSPHRHLSSVARRVSLGGRKVSRPLRSHRAIACRRLPDYLAAAGACGLVLRRSQLAPARLDRAALIQPVCLAAGVILAAKHIRG